MDSAMNKPFIIFALIVFWIAPTIQIVREHQLCPFVCRVDANGIKGAWYETNLPGLHFSYWASPEQIELQERVEP